MIRALVLLTIWLNVSAGLGIKMESMKERPQFEKLIKTEGHVEHELIFAVKQRNLGELHDILMDRSSPDSPNYQRWLSFQEVGELTSNPEAAKAIKAWLAESGIPVTWESAHGDYIKASATVAAWEPLLEASFHNYHDESIMNEKGTPKVFVRSQEYSIPRVLAGHVECVFNTVQVPPLINKSFHVGPEKITRTNLRVRPDVDLEAAFSVPAVTVSFLNSFYGIPSNTGNAAQNQSVFETSNQYMSQTDLKTFQRVNGLTQQKAIDIGGFQTSSCSLTSSGNNCDEGNLDIQFIMGISQVTSSIYWYVSSSGSTDPFVGWITAVANEAHPPQSNSISWGGIEQQYPNSTITQFNTEALKLSSMGVTIMVSSGDNGVANFGCPCNTGKRTSSSNCACSASSGSSGTLWTGTNSWSGSGYFPSFPATCPYVTAVGATQFSPSSTRPEVSCQANKGGVITTGGGFSTVYHQPSWQSAAVSQYFSGLSKTPASGYNAKGRGYPDISLLGVNYQVVIANTFQYLYGTSASAPVLAGFISLINAGRLAQGKSTVGFINPTLYSYGIANRAKYFNDVTIGNNTCCSSSAGICCTAGFVAATGWDPVTGWGSITYNNLSTILNAAPTPTAAPSTRAPSSTRIPSKTPTRQPTPHVGTPTAVPSTANIVTAGIRQLVSSPTMSAATFNSNAWNAYTFQQSVAQSVANTESVSITSVTDYEPFYGYYYYNFVTSAATSAAAASSSSAFSASSVSSVVVEYTVVANSFASVSTQINSAVSSGNFTAYLQYYATTNGATLLTNAYSPAVQVDAVVAPTAAPVSSPSSAVLSNDAIIAIAVVGAAVLIAIAGVVWFRCFRTRRSYTPAATSTARPTGVTVEMNAAAVGTSAFTDEAPTKFHANPLKPAPTSISPPKAPPKPPRANKTQARKAFQKGNTRDYI